MTDQIIITFLSALLPIALTTAIALLERRGQESRRNKLIDFAQKRVQFLNTFLTAQSLATTPEQFEILKRSVSQEIIQIRLDLLKEIEKINVDTARSRENNILQTFFLLYPLKGILAPIFRILFYGLLVLPILGALGLVLMMSSENSPISGPGTIVATVLGSLIYILPALLFRWLAIATNKRSQERSTVSQKAKMPTA
jgi:hypothetical protein